MTVDADSCLRFLREVRDVAFATVDEDGLPAVRVIDVMMVEGGRLYFVARAARRSMDRSCARAMWRS